MLFIAASSIAQLYVKPTSGGDPSFLYANDVQVYVEGTIGLTKNAAGPYEGSIYLRGDSQLFQGGSATYNSGDGLLSVYQTTNADQYDYNFWSSPVGLNAGAVGNTNNGPLRLNVSDTSDDGMPSAIPTDIGTTIFTPVWGGSSNSNLLYISSTWLYKYSNDTTNWQWVGGNDVVQPGYGFSMKGTNTSTTSTANNDPNAQQYDFRGRPNTGDIVVNLNNGESTLAGNPYPSALDLAVFFNDNITDITEIQFWDEDRSVNSHFYVDNKGGYGTWVPAGANAGNMLQGLYTPAPFLNYDNNGNPNGGSTGTGAMYPRRYAPIGQGFMINATAIGSSATFTNSQRTFVAMDGTNSVFRSSETAAIKSNTTPVLNVTSNQAESAEVAEDESTVTNIPYMRLNAYFPGSHRREMALLFSDKATTGFDSGFDANHPMDASSEMAMTLEDGKKLVIQTIPWSIDAIVPLMVDVDIPGSIVLSAYEETNLPFKKAYLFDAAQTTFQLITQGNTATANIEQAGESTNRFYIVFKSQEQVIVETADESGLTLAKETVDVFQDNRLSMMEILNPERFDIKEAAVFDMSGKLVHTENNIGEQTRYNFPTTTLSDGVYIVKLTTQENLVLDYKVTIFNKR